MRRLIAVFIICTTLSACSSGRDRLEAIGVVVNETLTNFKTDTGFEMINMRIVEVPANVELETFFEVIPLVRDVKSLKFSRHAIFCEHFDSIAKIDGLTQLVFEGCQLDRECLDKLTKLNKLESLAITRFDVASSDVSVLDQFPQLKTVSLVETSVDDAIADLLLSIPSLENAYLSNTKVTDAFVAKIGTSKTLTDLRLDGTAVTANGLLPLTETPRLKRLHVSHLEAGPVIADVIEGSPRLRAIVLNVTEKQARMLSGTVKVLTPERAQERLDD